MDLLVLNVRCMLIVAVAIGIATVLDGVIAWNLPGADAAIFYAAHAAALIDLSLRWFRFQHDDDLRAVPRQLGRLLEPGNGAHVLMIPLWVVCAVVIVWFVHGVLPP